MNIRVNEYESLSTDKWVSSLAKHWQKHAKTLKHINGRFCYRIPVETAEISMCKSRCGLKGNLSMICHFTVNPTFVSLHVIVSLLLFLEQQESTVLVKPVCKEQENYDICWMYNGWDRQWVQLWLLKSCTGR